MFTYSHKCIILNIYKEMEIIMLTTIMFIVSLIAYFKIDSYMQRIEAEEDSARQERHILEEETLWELTHK